MYTTMRSQDLWLGFAYDLFAATVLQELLAGWLDVDVGEYHHHVDSLHLYEHDTTAAGSVPEQVPAGPVMAPLGVDWPAFDPLLGRVISGDPVQEPGWSELSEVMRSYRSWRDAQRRAAWRLAEQTCGALAAALRGWYRHLERESVAG